MLIRREFVRAVLASLAVPRGHAQQAPEPFSAETFEADLIPAPDDARQWPAFRAALAAWRQARRAELGYDDKLYRRSEFAWAASSFACSFMLVWDEQFWHARESRYRLEEWLEEGEREFGGYDSLVFWQAYPRIGVDHRNQFDFFRDMPGGLEGLAGLVALLHRQGVRAYVPYKPWDTGTRRESKNDVEAVAELVSAIDADGIFLDTLRQGAAEFRARLDAVRPGVVLESELALPLERVHDHHLSWAQGFKDSPVPGILRNKWFERRHMQHQIRRWSHDHSAELHTAWMNGSGILVWENVFGSWVGWNARDRSILRAMLPIQRAYADLFAGEGWTPLVETEVPAVYASLWEGSGTRLWTLVNRADSEASGPLLKTEAKPQEEYFDLVRGRQLRPVVAGGSVVLEGTIRPRGIGCFLARPPWARRAGERELLERQARTEARASSSTVFPARETVWKAPPPAPAARKAPEGMVAIGPVDFDRDCLYRIRECGQLTSMDYTPGQGHQRIHQLIRIRRRARLARYAIDLTPVTNREFARFLRESGYRPRHAENFLRHWSAGGPPEGLEDHPVVYVDLEDARAYARWAGKRLPTELEWQYAAEGPDGLTYPWGNEMLPGRANDGSRGGTTPVRAFPDGRSPFGCYDMCGNTWEWTESEHSDGRTRFAMVRGGSYFKAEGSHWYADGGPQPAAFGMKFLLMWPGMDRCATIGFRCAVSLEPEA